MAFSLCSEYCVKGGGSTKADTQTRRTFNRKNNGIKDFVESSQCHAVDCIPGIVTACCTWPLKPADLCLRRLVIHGLL